MDDKNKMTIVGLDKAKVLAALYNRAKPQGLGFLHYNPTPMTIEQAQKILDSGQTYFDYLSGRVMKVDLSEDEVNTWGYNRDNGNNAAEMAVAELRHFNEVNPKTTQEAHQSRTLSAAEEMKAKLGDRSRVEKGPSGVAVFHLGIDDEIAEHLRPALDRVTKREILLIDQHEVEKAFIDCFYKEEELKGVEGAPEGTVIVEGIQNKIGFHPGRLEEKRAKVTEWLKALPHTFRKNSGGGWSFLNACNQEDGIQWTGFHQHVDQLFCLGMGLKLVECQVPRKMWMMLPGGMPYYVINIE